MKVNTVDGGTKRRVRYVPFESKFVDAVADANWSNCENMYSIDRSLKQRMPAMGPALMRILWETIQFTSGVLLKHHQRFLLQQENSLNNTMKIQNTSSIELSDQDSCLLTTNMFCSIEIYSQLD